MGSGLDVLRSQARVRCPLCKEGAPLAFSLRQAPYWLHPKRHPDGAVSIEAGCSSAFLYDRMLAYLGSKAIDCGRCLVAVAGQREDGVWGHLDAELRFSEPCERAAVLGELTRSEVAA